MFREISDQELNAKVDSLLDQASLYDLGKEPLDVWEAIHRKCRQGVSEEQAKEIRVLYDQVDLDKRNRPNYVRNTLNEFLVGLGYNREDVNMISAPFLDYDYWDFSNMVNEDVTLSEDQTPRRFPFYRQRGEFLGFFKAIVDSGADISVIIGGKKVPIEIAFEAYRRSAASYLSTLYRGCVYQILELVMKKIEAITLQEDVASGANQEIQRETREIVAEAMGEDAESDMSIDEIELSEAPGRIDRCRSKLKFYIQRMNRVYSCVARKDGNVSAHLRKRMEKMASGESI